MISSSDISRSMQPRPQVREGVLLGELSLEEIAGAVEVSRFHLSRAFAVSTGNSLAGYVRARRLTEAAKALVQGAPDILTVALESGYGSHEAFTRAFRQHFGLTPEQIRAQARFEEITLQEPIRMDKTITTPLASPRIVKSEEILIFGLGEHYIQSNAGMPAQWNRFLPYLGQIPGQIGNVAYGVICNCDEAGAATTSAAWRSKSFRHIRRSSNVSESLPRATPCSSIVTTSRPLPAHGRQSGNMDSQTLVARLRMDHRWSATMNISTLRSDRSGRLGDLGSHQILITRLSRTESSAEILEQVHQRRYQQFLRANLI